MAAWDPFEERPDVVGGRYRLGEVLGEGGSGCVFRAIDQQTGAELAVKVVEAPAMQRPLRFLAEARDMARLRHPRVVRVLDAGRDRQWYYSVMELLSGGSLKDKVVRDGPMAPGPALELQYQILQGLQAVHAASLVHRDIKPHNVLLDDRGEPKLTDLGLARHEAGDVPWKTRTGESLGSPTYRAPEQSRNPTEAGREADLYSMGGVLWFQLTSQRPKLFYMLTDAEFDEVTAGIPAEIGAVIKRATALRPEQRYRTAAEMASAVAAAYDALPERRGQPPVAARWMQQFDAAPTRTLWERFRSLLGG
ncbi:MAG: serine/threonine-protein kinase [Myxococcota bacterium]